MKPDLIEIPIANYDARQQERSNVIVEWGLGLLGVLVVVGLAEVVVNLDNIARIFQSTTTTTP